MLAVPRFFVKSLYNLCYRFLVIFMVSPVFAAENVLTSIAYFQADYDSNHRLLVENTEALSGFMFKPELNFTSRREESTTDLSADLGVYRYDLSGYNSENPRLNGKYDKFFETGDLSVTLGAKREATRFTEFDESGFFSQGTTYRKDGSLGFYAGKDVGSNAKIFGQANVGGVNYESDDYADYTSNTFQLGAQAIVSRTLKFQLVGFQSVYEMEYKFDLPLPALFDGNDLSCLDGFDLQGINCVINGGVTTDSYSRSLKIGVDWYPTEVGKLSLLLGPTQVLTQQTYSFNRDLDDLSSLLNIDFTSDDIVENGYTGEVGISSIGEKIDWSLSYVRSESPSSVGVLVAYNDVSFSLTGRYSRRGSCYLGLRYILQLEVGEGQIGKQSGDVERREVSIACQRDVSRKMYLNTSFTYRQLDRDNDDDVVHGVLGSIILAYKISERNW